MQFTRFRKNFPGWSNVILAGLSAVLLILSFPDFDYWFLAWFALIPLLWAIDRENRSVSSFVLGWIFGACFFFGTCWWLAYAPIHYAAFPAIFAYLLVLIASSGAAIFPGMFAAVLAFLLRRFGRWAFFAAPFVWVFSEFVRYWLTGNNWNALGYSQAFVNANALRLASYGGVELASFAMVGVNLAVGAYVGLLLLSYAKIARWFFQSSRLVSRGAIPQPISVDDPQKEPLLRKIWATWVILLLIGTLLSFIIPVNHSAKHDASSSAEVIAIQPNVPMSGLTHETWLQLRKRHVELTEKALATINEQRSTNNEPITVIFPESPMNFAYAEDDEFRRFIGAFASKHNANVLFNSAEPDIENRKYFNSAVLVDAQGGEIAQYDKIYLLPFGEAVPVPLESIVPAFVGSFSYGKNYNLIPLGDAKAGIMICFESHFGGLSREYVRRGADVIIEMTNDGYLGPTPVLRQHLANAVFRAVETNRPVLRVTNVGITAYINERGEVLDAAQPYTEETRVWSVAKSDGSETFYVKYGDWFAWLCAAVTLMLLILSWRRQSVPPAVAGG